MTVLQNHIDASEEHIHKQRQNELIKQVAAQLSLSSKQVLTTAQLLQEGNTIPFIARYRKEMTGELNENQLRDVQEKLEYLFHLSDRKEEVIRLIQEQDKLTDVLNNSIQSATKLQEVEDLYRPYRQKRKTRASVAKEKGLMPLSQWIWAQSKHADVQKIANSYINEQLGINDVDMAIQGAMDILAEAISDNIMFRRWIFRYMFHNGLLTSTAKDKDQSSVYENYYNYQEKVSKIPPHRILAMNRGEREKILQVGIQVEKEVIYQYMQTQLNKTTRMDERLLVDLIEDAYKRLLAPSIEREIRTQLTQVAEDQAISVFSTNLRHLLLQPPIHGKRVLGVDPAYRTGCKLAVVDDTGKVLEIAVTYPTPPYEKKKEAALVFKQLIEKYDVSIVAIGNGTASRETEQFVAQMIQTNAYTTVKYIIVNEAGASVYSASSIAQKEFPELDVSERSAISIARRVQDPLAELVKIEPQSIGVGQYQHDVSAKKLDKNLAAIVESAVNYVGVDINTASPSLLMYVSGINNIVANSIVKYREKNGRFINRQQLMNVPRLGPKTYEQCIGFMRIHGGSCALDQTGIHPESYDCVNRLFYELNIDMLELGSKRLSAHIADINVDQLASTLDIGVPTLKDILDSLKRPGRDPREHLPPPILRTDVLKMEQLVPGMKLEGTVRNVIDFGVFVDIGLKGDGLVHISELSEKYVHHPMDIVSVGDSITVWVLYVDNVKSRVSLTMKEPT